MPMFVWRVWCNTEGKHHRVNSVAAPAQCPVNPGGDTIDPVKSVILEELGAGAAGGGNRIEVSLVTDKETPFVRIHESDWTTLGEMIYPGTDAWTPSVSRAIMGREGTGSETGDFCDGGGKPAALMLEYTGEDCSASANSQPGDKWSCSGDPAMASSVRIVANDKSTWNDGSAKVWHDATVAIDGVFLVAASSAGRSKLGSTTWVHILSVPGDTVLQTVKFHTSCSQPLFANDQFGSIIARSFIADASGGSSGGDSTGPGINGPASRYRFRLYDLTNGNVIAQIPDGGGNLALNVLEEIFEATEFSNLSATQAIIEIQAHKNAVATGDDDGRLYHVTLEE